jgi:hypothetical protein
MATDLGPVKPATSAKYESFLEEQLGRTRRRIRLLDVGVSCLVLVIATLVYGLAVALADRAWELPAGFRQIAFALYAVSALVYVVLAIVLPLYRQVNPYFAARELERTLPGAKNSVINWLDLRGKNLPPAIRSAVGGKAAKDLATADLEKAVSARRAVWAGGIAGGLLLALLVFFFRAPGQFWSLMGRAFVPFQGGVLAQETGLHILQPAGGDATVSMKSPVNIVVEVDGKEPPADGPRALKLEFRYPGESDYRFLSLEHDVDRAWKVTIPAEQVLNGFYYRVSGGDARTREYRVQVKSTPLVTDFLATYHFPEFVRRNDYTDHHPDLKAVRGTRVALVVHTNRPVKDGALELDQAGDKKVIEGQPVPKEPQAIRFDLELSANGSYRVQYTSRAGEVYDEPIRYGIDVDPDTEVTFRYRPYFGWDNQTFRVPLLPDLTALRGTEVTLDYHANRPVKEGRLEMKFAGGQKKTLRAETERGKPEQLRFRFVMEHDGQYQLAYTTAAGESVRDPNIYPIKVLPDYPPRVELTRPGKDIELPANGVLELEGRASDDFGIKRLVLRTVAHTETSAVELAPKPYRGGKTLRTGTGRYPLNLAYRDFVELAKVRGPRETRFRLKPGMELEYWLEATDNCDYPEANRDGQIGRSNHYRVKILEPQNKQKQQEQKNQANSEQQKHEQKQDQDLNKQNQAPKPPDPQQNQRPQKPSAPKNAKQPENAKPQNAKPENKGGKEKKQDGRAGNQENRQDGRSGKNEQEDVNRRLKNAFETEKRDRENSNKDKGGSNDRKEQKDRSGADSKEQKEKGGTDSKEKKNRGGSDRQEQKDKGGADSKEQKDKGGADRKERKDKGAADSKERKDKRGASSAERRDKGTADSKPRQDKGGADSKERKDKGGADSKKQKDKRRTERKEQRDKGAKDSRQRRDKGAADSKERKDKGGADSKERKERSGADSKQRKDKGSADSKPQKDKGGTDSKERKERSGPDSKERKDKGGADSKERKDKGRADSRQRQDKGTADSKERKDKGNTDRREQKDKGSTDRQERKDKGNADSKERRDKGSTDRKEQKDKSGADRREQKDKGGADSKERKDKGSGDRREQRDKGGSDKERRDKRRTDRKEQKDKGPGDSQQRKDKRGAERKEQKDKGGADSQERKDKGAADSKERKDKGRADSKEQKDKGGADSKERKDKGNTDSKQQKDKGRADSKERKDKSGADSKQRQDKGRADSKERKDKGRTDGKEQKDKGGTDRGERKEGKDKPNRKGKKKGSGPSETPNAGEGARPDDFSKPSKVDPEAAKKASDLNLAENLRDWLNKLSPEERKKFLNKAGVSPKQLQEWEKTLDNRLKRAKDLLSGPSKGRKGRANNQGPKRAKTGPQNDSVESGRAKPPAEYESIFEDFTRNKDKRR